MDLFNIWNILTVLSVLFATVLIYFKWSYTYWKKKNIPYLNPRFPFGTLENPLTRTMSIATWLKKNYNELKSQGHKHGGIYNFARPAYLPIAPEYIKNIMLNDFDHFVDRGYYHNEKEDPLSAHLFAVGGDKWKNLRSKISPTFASGKMKMMFETLIQCTVPMQGAIGELCKNNQEIDIKDIAACYTTDVISSCVCGVDSNSFKNDCEIRRFGRQIWKRSKFQSIAGTFLFISNPEIGRLLRMKFLPTDLTKFFMGVVKDTIKYRETNNIMRKDMLQILIDLKNKISEKDINGEKVASITVEEIAAQVFVFLVAGFETTSSTMSYCLFELSMNRDIQQKVRKEINRVSEKYGGEITFESLKDMTYLGQVIEETLRKHPPAAYLTRKCVKDYKMPNTNLLIEKNTQVFIPVLGIHHDPEYYPDPQKFEPERFSKEERERRNPFTFLAYGGGPRTCIGYRFGLVHVKLGIVALLRDYEFTLNSKTQLPLKIDPHRNFFLTTKNTIWLNAKKLKSV